MRKNLLRTAYHWAGLARPGQRAWTGAALGLLIAALIFALPALRAYFGGTGVTGMLIGLVAFVLLAALAAAVAWLAWRVLSLAPGRYAAAAGAGVALLYLAIAPNLLDPTTRYPVVILAIVIVASLLGAAAWSLLRGGWRRASWFQRGVIAVALALGLSGALGGGAWLLSDGPAAAAPLNAAALSGVAVPPLALPDPGQPGPYAVRTLTYGSGRDLRRPEYGAAADLLTQPVDGSQLVAGWSGLRRDAWDFGPEALPLNGRVWLPEGPGPFPLVLIVHGNHVAEEFSDPGYAYLGELFASRGIIAVSVDENFLNVSPSADLGFVTSLTEEDDARGWLLLEHLQAWRGWHETPGTPFTGKVDLARIALIGHSRGGEAVAVAAAFNRLPCYPDDCRLAFDYNFGIRAVAAIAPIDGRYLPANELLPLTDVSYFVLHSSHDQQTAFAGRGMYGRVRFTGDAFHFKAALYFAGGNHGQFNTVWGRKDILEPGMRLYNTTNLMPGEAQRQIARVTLSAFLEATLHDKAGYLPLFRDVRAGAPWLPDTVYLARYRDSAAQVAAAFDEDLDLTTATLPGASLHGENLTMWREGRPLSRELGRVSDRAVFLGWDNAQAGTASFALRCTASCQLAPQGHTVLTFALADADESAEPIDLTVEVCDRAGDMARLPLSRYALLQPRIAAPQFKASWLSSRPTSEIVLQTFEFPLAWFASANPAFDPAGLAEARLVFDRTPAGMVVLDDWGVR